MFTVVLGVSGSVAAYRAADVARELIRHVYLVEEDMGGGEPRQFLVHTVNGDPVHLTSNTFADTWEEVIE